LNVSVNRKNIVGCQIFQEHLDEFRRDSEELIAGTEQLGELLFDWLGQLSRVPNHIGQKLGNLRFNTVILIESVDKVQQKFSGSGHIFRFEELGQK